MTRQPTRPQQPVKLTVANITAAIVVVVYLAGEIAWQAYLHRSAPGGWRAAILPATVLWIGATCVALAWRALLAWLDRKTPADGTTWLPLLLSYPVIGFALGLLNAATDPARHWLRDTTLFTTIGVVISLIILWNSRGTRAQARSVVKIRRRP
jgi:hypothetical protein